MINKFTKIVATISDKHCEPEFLKELYDEGMNVVRLNTAHQTPEGSLKVIESVRQVSDKIAIMVDTKGPEVRTVLHGDTLILKTGDEVIVSNEPEGKYSFSTNYDGFINDMKEGSTILIDDGAIALEVVKKESTKLICKALNDEVIKDRKSVNVPGSHLNVPSLSEKDLKFIDFAIEQDVDFIAHSFVRSPEDVKNIQDILDKHKSRIKIVAKIENKEGVDNLNKILNVVSGVMIARGDLGIEIPGEQVPYYQKHIIEMCRKRKRPVITATQLLHSMIENPRPTRAEVSDVANAVYDGTDALMLSGETAYGKYPLESVKTMVKIARESEKARWDMKKETWKDPKNNQRNFLARGAANACLELPIKAILSDTESGRSARILSAYRVYVPIFAKSPRMRVVRELALSYGIFPDFMDYQASTDQLVENSLATLLEADVIDEKDLVVIMGGAPGQSEGTNFIEINKAQTCVNLYKSGTAK